MFWKLFNWAFDKAAKKVADDEYGPGQTAWKPDVPQIAILDTPVNPAPNPPATAAILPQTPKPTPESAA